MRILPSRARLAGAGLLLAAVTIGILGVLTLSELSRESELHRAVLAAQGVKDSLDKLRTHLNELRAASRLGALTGDSEAFADIERRAGQVETELEFLSQRASAEALYKKLSGSLGGRQAFYVPVGAITRLQVGPFESRAAAESACKAAGVPCFPVPGK